MTKIQVHKTFEALQEMVFEPLEMSIFDLKVDSESAEYEACSFKLEKYSIVFRAAKITPTKIGQFVTLWKRNQDGITAPFDVSDNIDFAIICTRKDDHFGAFIFPKSALLEKGILTDKSKDGKRGFRVYPPWGIADNKQAIQTQEWQLKCFLEAPIDFEKSKFLFKK